MRKLRSALVLVGVLAFVGVLTVLVVPERWVANRAESAASTFFGVDLRIGSLSLNRFSRQPSAQFSFVVLANAAQEKFLHLGHFFVSVNLWQLIKGNLVVEQVEIADSSVALAVDEAGRPNWEFLIDAFSPDDADLRQQDTNQSSSDQENTDRAIAIPVIKALSVENLAVTLDDKSTNRLADLKISASGSPVSSTEPALLSAEGAINGESVRSQATLTALAPIDFSPKNFNLDLQAQLGGSTVNVTGALTEVTKRGDIDLEFSMRSN